MLPNIFMAGNSVQQKDREEKPDKKPLGRIHKTLKALRYPAMIFAAWTGVSMCTCLPPPQRFISSKQRADFAKFKDLCERDDMRVLEVGSAGYNPGNSYIPESIIEKWAQYLCVDGEYSIALYATLEKQYPSGIPVLKYFQERYLLQTVDLTYPPHLK